jgi:predicted NAD-dependent protein-ADP-ribosyltransferase YbiA (DUF1768 family)
METIYEQFRELYKDEQTETIHQAYKTAIEAKIVQSPEVLNVLVETGTAPIHYESPDLWLGRGSNQTGQNNYGKLLEEIRRDLSQSKVLKSRQDAWDAFTNNLYTIFVAYHTLRKLIKQGNDLESYSAMTASKILDKLKADEIDLVEPLDKFTVVEAWEDMEKGDSSRAIISPIIRLVLKKPRVLATLIRGEMLEDLRERELLHQKRIILELQLNDILRKDYPEISERDYAKVRNAHLSLLDPHEELNLENQLFRLYQEGMLSENLSEKIENQLKLIVIPSETDVSEAKALARAIREEGEKEQFSILSPKEDSDLYQKQEIQGLREPAIVTEDGPLALLSPFDTSQKISIKGNVYPSIAYYELATRLQKIDPKADIVNRSISGIERDLQVAEQEFYQTQLKRLATLGLETKFQDPLSREVLLATGDHELVWNDPSDPILGVGEPGRENFIGLELQRLRAQYRDEVPTEPIEITETTSLEQLMQNKILQTWVTMRLRDMCTTLVLFQERMLLQGQVDFNMDEAGDTILDNIYRPCTVIANLKRIEVPQSVHQTIKTCMNTLGNDSVSDKLIASLWTRVASLLDFAIDKGQIKTEADLLLLLNKVEQYISKPKQCELILDDEEANCTLWALIGLNLSVAQIYADLGLSCCTVTAGDLALGTSILLNLPRLRFLDVGESIFSLLDSKDKGMSPSTFREQEVSFRDMDGTEDEPMAAFEEDEGGSQTDFADIGFTSSSVTFTIHELAQIAQILQQDLHAIQTRGFEQQSPKEIDIGDSEVRLVEQYLNFILQYELSPQIKLNRINFFSTPK